MNNPIPFPVQSHSLMAANCYGSNPGKQVSLSSVKKPSFPPVQIIGTCNWQMQTIGTQICNKKKVGFKKDKLFHELFNLSGANI